jgi:GxxExxY protein
MELLHKEITDKVLKTFYQVYNELGFGFLERVYQNAMFYELKAQGFICETEKPIKVYYKNLLVGEYRADIIIDNKVILELKASEVLVYENELQLINYLKATEIEVGLLLNFGQKPEFKRKIFTNENKKIAQKEFKNP